MSLEHIFLERCADLLPEKEADVSLSAEEFTMSKGGLVEPGLQNAPHLLSYWGGSPTHEEATERQTVP